MVIGAKEKESAKLHKTRILQQSLFWSKVKELQGFTPRCFSIQKENAPLQEDLLLLLKPVGDATLGAYVPYGPKNAPPSDDQGLFLEELSETLRKHLPNRCSFIRYDLPWESPWAHDLDRYSDDGEWAGPPSKKSQELRVNFSTNYWNLRKAPSNLLPTNTIFLDLTSPKKLLLDQMHKKTRYNIRLSLRKGVTVRTGKLEDLSTWYDLYTETCQRNGIYLHDISFFRDLFSADRVSPGESIRLLLAEDTTTNCPKALAALFLAFSGSRASYLYGASSSEKRNMMATYALQWEAILQAKEAACREYDMFGISPSPNASHPLYGLYRFKRGFGGKVFHRMGCWDYPLIPEDWKSCLAAEIKSQGYHL